MNAYSVSASLERKFFNPTRGAKESISALGGFRNACSIKWRSWWDLNLWYRQAVVAIEPSLPPQSPENGNIRGRGRRLYTNCLAFPEFGSLETDT